MAPARVRLQVLHAWWQLPILRGLAALIAVVLIIAYARHGIHQAEERTRRLQREIHEREEAEKRVQLKQRELEHMSRIAAEIIRKLRTFIGRRQLDREELDLNQIVEETVPMFRRELEGHEVALELDLSPRLPRVEADRVQLQQVLVNLVLNGIDALSKQPPEERSLKVSTREGAATASILVSDTGPGIDEADLDRVFEPFFTTRDEGMGMGLAICSTIADAHDGELTVTRNPDRGVTFELSLPLSRPEEIA